MHHLYPSLKGDQLCPLGFHPQTRYPTRCKRCFRDYKEHGGRRGVEDVAASSPNLSDGLNSRPSSRTWTSTQNLSSLNGGGSSNDIVVHFNVELKKRPQSWASTPDIDEADVPTRGGARGGGFYTAEDNNVDLTVKLPVPPRRHTTTLDLKEVEDSLSHNRLKAPSSSSSSSSSSRNIPEDLIILSSDSLSERVRKMNLLKKQRSLNSRESSRERSVPKKSDDEAESKPPPDRPERSKSGTSLSTELKRSSLPPKKTTATASSSTSTSASSQSALSSATTSSSTSSSTTAAAASAAATKSTNSLKSSTASSATKASASNTTTTKSSSSSATSSSSSSAARRKESDREKATKDVEFLLKIKDTKYSDKRNAHDNMSLTTETTETTLMDRNDREMQDEMKSLQTELQAMKTRAERAERDKSDILLRRLASMDTAPNRTAASEALMLQSKVNELKEQLEKVNDEKRRLNTRMKDIENNPKNSEYELKRKLKAAEQLCEELMEENQDAKKEIINLQAEMDEIQDTFRDDEIKAKTNIQKDLEKTTKNCRILSFKLKKCERKIDMLEQEKQGGFNDELVSKVLKLEEELRFSNSLTQKLQAEAEELRNPGKKKAPMLGVLGKSTSADAKFTRESLTRGGSQEDPQQLLRDLQDSVERESDLKDQLKFAEEEAENLRKKVARFEDENDSLMMQLKKMATRSRTTRKLSPIPHRLAPEVQADRDEGISDEDDPAELRILLELNEQEASILRLKVEDLERDNTEMKKQVREIQDKMLGKSRSSSPLTGFTSLSAGNASDKKLKALNDELMQLRKSVVDKDRVVERLQAEMATKGGKTLAQDSSIDTRRQLNMVEQEAAVLRTKISTLESENEKLLKENKRIQLQALRKSGSSDKSSPNGSSSDELAKLKESLAQVEQERDNLNIKLKRIILEAGEKLPARTPKRITDLTPKNHLKKWVEELEDEITEMRVVVLNSGGDKLKMLETEKNRLEEELARSKQKLSLAEGDIQRLKTLSGSTLKVSDLEQKLKKSEEESKKLNTKVKDLEEKIKKQDSQIKLAESAKSTGESQAKRDKEKMAALEKDYEKEHKEREKLESKLTQMENELSSTRKSAEKTKSALEKDIKELKAKSSKSESKQVQELKKQIEELQISLVDENKRYRDLTTHWEKLSEETILMRAQLTTEKQNLELELNSLNQKLADMDRVRIEKTEFAKKLSEAQKKIQDLEAKNLKSGSIEHEKTMLKNKLADREQEYDRLRRENEMNIDLVFQLRKDNDDLSHKLNDFSRIEQAQSSINGQSAGREAEIKSLRVKLQNLELQLKSEVAATRLRYEQQVKNLSGELTSMQRQCEKFKKDRDAFKQMLESAQKKIGDLKANTGRQSRNSMHSSDDDDKSKIVYLEQQIGCLEDQLVESRLEVSRIKTELVSERSANEIKISEMRSKLNEFEEDRVIGSGRTKIPGMKTKLELSWQKEREDQQRLLQETSTLARDLRQTLFEVERERDKERLESKRRLEQTKRSTEEELEEGRKKIAELQCDLLELRDVHAKLRTSNEKLRRERERYEKELVKRRMEQDGGERKVGALLQTVDELVKIAPDLKMATTSGSSSRSASSSGNTLRPEQSNARRSRSPSPTLTSSQITNVLARLAEASEELRKFQRISEDENERSRLRRSNLRRAASQENDPHGSTSSVASAAGSQRSNGSKLSRSSGHNGSLIRKSLSLDHSIQKDQNIWRQDDGSVSSIQSIDSELGGMVRDSSYDSRLDSRLSGGSTQSDIPRGPRKKKKSLMGKLRSLTKSNRNSESEVSIQGSDSDISVASDMRASKKDLRGRLSGMFKRSGSATRSESTERIGTEHKPVAVTVVGDPDGPKPREPPAPNAMTPKPIRSIKPPTPTTPLTKRRAAK